MRIRRIEEDKIIQERKKKWVDPLNSDEGFIAAVEDDLDYEFEQGVDYVKEKYADTYNTIDYDITKAKQAWSILMSLKWIINFWLTGIPYLLYCVIAVVYNLFVNIWQNNWWAEGNLFLLGNTIYLLVQSSFSMLMMFEMAFIIRWIKPLRVISVTSAFLYNVFYFFSLGNWIWEIFFADKSYLDDASGAIDVIWNMMIVYNLIVHFPIVPMNIAMIVKEIQMQVFQLIGDPNSPDPADRL